MIRTRFRPSANGPLHFGGAYVARQNWWFARAKGGKFVLIVDDVVPVYTWGPSAEQCQRMREYGERFVEDLTWLGWAPDEVHYASEFHAAHMEAVANLGLPRPSYREVPCLLRYVHTCSESGNTCSYNPWLTAGRVSDDHCLGITDFVRGGDLVGEVQLYDHFARTLYGEGHRVNQDYTEIIVEPSGAGPCSKSDGTAGIADYREAGVSAEQIREALGKLLDLPGSYGNPCSKYRQVDGSLLVAP